MSNGTGDEGDRAGERIIRKMIEERFPDHGINGEEYGVKEGKSGFTWVLDPIDGTRSFVCGMPTWATLIALYAEGKPVIGVMNQPFVGDLFYGNPEGAWNNYRGTIEPLRARAGVKLADAAAGTTAPELYRSERDQHAFQNLRKAVKLMRMAAMPISFRTSCRPPRRRNGCRTSAYDIGALIPIIEALAAPLVAGVAAFPPKVAISFVRFASPAGGAHCGNEVMNILAGIGTHPDKVAAGARQPTW